MVYSSEDDSSEDGKPPAKRMKGDSDEEGSAASADASEEAQRDDPSLESESSAAAAVAAAAKDSKDPKIWGNIDYMKEIGKSPYEPPNASAEVGESAFDELKKLLVPADEKGTIHTQASKLFGSRLAESIVTAFFQIGRSGMLFSPQWIDGKIRGVAVGWIPKPILLLCLHEQRFVRASEAILSGIIKDLEVDNIIGDSISEYKLDREFINLSSNTAYTYTKNKTVCYKCEIFAARAFRAVKVLKWKVIEPTLWKKIKDCLTIMNEFVRVSKNGVAKRISELNEDEAPAKEKKSSKKKGAAKKQKEPETDAEEEDAETRKRRREERLENIDIMIGL